MFFRIDLLYFEGKMWKFDRVVGFERWDFALIFKHFAYFCFCLRTELIITLSVLTRNMMLVLGCKKSCIRRYHRFQNVVRIFLRCIWNKSGIGQKHKMRCLKSVGAVCCATPPKRCLPPTCLG